MKTYFFILLYFCFSSMSWGTEVISPAEKLEQEVLSKIQKDKASPTKLMASYLLIGREAYSSGEYILAKKYFEEVAKLECDENKIEAFINLVAIAHLQNEPNEKKAWAQKLKSYLEKNPQYKDRRVMSYIDYVETGKLTPHLDLTFGVQENYVLLEGLFREKSYKKALQLFNVEGLKDVDIGTKIFFDLLNTLENKKNNSNLLCREMYLNYPNTASYSMKICSLLISYLENGRLSQEALRESKAFFLETYPEKMFLVDALQELK